MNKELKDYLKMQGWEESWLSGGWLDGDATCFVSPHKDYRIICADRTGWWNLSRLSDSGGRLVEVDAGKTLEDLWEHLLDICKSKS